MASQWLQKQAGKVIGGVGKAIDTVGNALGSPVKNFNVSENLERIGGMWNPPVARAAEIYQTPAIPGVTYTAQTQNPGGYTSSGGNNNIPSNPNPIDYSGQINQGVDDYGAIIDRDYEIAMGSLGQQESGLRTQAGISEQGIDNEFAEVKTNLGQEQATKESSAQANLATGEKEATSNIQQARDLWRETTQRNIAQLSGLGISSSSVAEAMAETLGVETARRIAGATGALSEIRQNVTKELGRIKDYYAEKITNLSNTVALEKSKIQQALMTGLNQINTARQQAANDKAARRQELITNAQNAIINLQTQAQQFEQSMKQWAAEKSSALSSVLNQDQFNAMMQKQYGVLSQQYNPTQFNITPNQNVSSTGSWSGSYNVSPKEKSKKDLITELLNES